MKANVVDYDLVAPPDLRAALSLLTESPGIWQPMAGGTELMVQLAAGQLTPQRLLSIWRLTELRGIDPSAESLRLGATCTFSEIRRDQTVCYEFPLLARAASWTGGIANQNRGTLGGNIVNASPAADSPPALLLYDAAMELASTRGVRNVPYSAFHTGYKQTVLEKDELLTAILLPRRLRPGLHYLRKVGTRKAQAISKIALGAYGEMQNEKVAEIRIAFASMAPTPLRCFATERCLIGEAMSNETVHRACDTLAGEIQPIDDIRSTAAYRKQVAVNLFRDFLSQLASREGQ